MGLDVGYGVGVAVGGRIGAGVGVVANKGLPSKRTSVKTSSLSSKYENSLTILPGGICSGRIAWNLGPTVIFKPGKPSFRSYLTVRVSSHLWNVSTSFLNDRNRACVVTTGCVGSGSVQMSMGTGVAVGRGVGFCVGSGIAVALGVGVFVGTSVGVGVGEGIGMGVGADVGSTAGVGVGVFVGVGVDAAPGS